MGSISPKVYFQGKADPCDFDTVAGRVPPLPVQFPPPFNYHVVDPPEPATPNVLGVFEKVNSAPDKRLQVYVVLKEDAYESAVGDGIFRCFDSAYFKREDAESRVGKDLESGGSYTYHIREVYLIVSNGEVLLDTEGCDLSPFDHFTRQQICDELARRMPPGTD